MGDRYTWYEKCPKCDKEMEYYDAPSSLMYIGKCDHCDYHDPLGYYEAPDNVIELCTEEQAREKGLIKNCPLCKENMTWWEEVEYKKCMECNQLLVNPKE